MTPKPRTIGYSIVAALLLASCGQSGADRVTDEAAAPAKQDPAALLAAAIDGPHRSAEDKARDTWRHPAETLSFFGVEPDMTVVEVWPGGGWYTRILAPYLKSGGGTYIAAHVDPTSSERSAQAVNRFAEEFADPAIFGTVKVTALGAGDIAPEGSADVVLTFRNVHNWLGNDSAEGNFQAFFKALKPGGVLGVVEHRASEDAPDDRSTGYVKESTVRALAEAAGFEFVEASEINANPNDTKDHPYGVWTLPPVRRSAAAQGQEDPEFDRAHYDSIGESDRMTLKFKKPAP